jgi:hypothetical protein
VIATLSRPDFVEFAQLRRFSHPLLHLARDNRFRARAACDGRWRKNREIGIAADEPTKTDLAIPNGRELAAQQTWWGTVLGCRSECVDNADAADTRMGPGSAS